MTQPVSLDPQIVDGLYYRALVLSDEVRATFALSRRIALVAEGEDLARVALSCEGLRTTTRMLHAVAWLLNQRSYLNGDLSEFQLERCGNLPPSDDGPDPQRLALLTRDVQDLIAATDQFYERLLRLDSAWRDKPSVQQERLIQLRVGT